MSPILIVGCRRSGTTLLRAMLDRHSRLAVHPQEPQFIVQLYRRYGFELRDFAQALEFVANHPYQAASSGNELLRDCSSPAEFTLSALVECYMTHWLETVGGDQKPVLKDPEFTYYLDAMLALFPKMHVIHIIRDPRANVASQRARWPQATVWECACLWRDAIRNLRDWTESGHSLVTEIQYEELAFQPQETLQNVCRALDIEFEPGMLEFELPSRSFAPGEDPQQVVYRAVDVSRVNLWRQRLSPLEIRLIESCCQTEMGWWEYEPIQPYVPAWRLALRQGLERSYFRTLSLARSWKQAVR